MITYVFFNRKVGVYIPRKELYLVKQEGVAYSWRAPLAVYNGRCYIGLTASEGGDDSLLGEYLGTCTGLLDEWSEKDCYVDFASNIEGKLYTVKGYDTDFMIGFKAHIDEPSHSFTPLINDNDINLKHGADLFEDRLHLAGNYNKVTYQSYADWSSESEKVVRVFDDASQDILTEFVDSLNKGKFFPIEAILSEDENGANYEDISKKPFVF